jgi:hypothetical protein
MRKTINFFLLFCLLGLILQAETDKKVNLSALGGGNLYTLNIQNPGELPLPRHQARLAYSFGAGVRFRLLKGLSLETDILYKAKRSELVEFYGTEWGDTFYKLNYLALPVLLRYEFPLARFVVSPALGLEAGYLLSSKIDDKKNDAVVNPIPNTDSMDFQAVFGLGVRYKKISLDLRYGWGLKNLNTEQDSPLVVKNRGLEFLFSFHF